MAEGKATRTAEEGFQLTMLNDPSTRATHDMDSKQCVRPQQKGQPKSQVRERVKETKPRDPEQRQPSNPPAIAFTTVPPPCINPIESTTMIYLITNAPPPPPPPTLTTTPTTTITTTTTTTTTTTRPQACHNLRGEGDDYQFFNHYQR
ncbi:hypothetical protein SprV_0100374800 [Sparganum proliferum]